MPREGADTVFAGAGADNEGLVCETVAAGATRGANATECRAVLAGGPLWHPAANNATSHP